jgi:hypothetical protein
MIVGLTLLCVCHAEQGRWRSRHSSKVEPMSESRQGVTRRLTYIPRFIHHFKQRRQLGQSVGQASRSARERMRHYR